MSSSAGGALGAQQKEKNKSGGTAASSSRGGGGGGGGSSSSRRVRYETQAESLANLALLDPPRWGWTAGGGIADLLTPHERARRKAAKRSFLRLSALRRQQQQHARAPPRRSPPPPPPPPRRRQNDSSSAPPQDEQQAPSPGSSPCATGTATAATAAADAADATTTKYCCDPRKLGVVDPTCSSSACAGESSDAARQQQREQQQPGASGTGNDCSGDGRLAAAEAMMMMKPPPPPPGNHAPAAAAAATAGDRGGDDGKRQLSSAPATPEEAAAASSTRESKRRRKSPPGARNGNSSSSAEHNVQSDAFAGAAAAAASGIVYVGPSPPSSSSAGGGSGRSRRGISSGGGGNTGKKPVRFSALHLGTGILDVHTYHRGREGVELRDEKSGELMCDVEPTDTNCDRDEPRLVAQVTVKFPLEDDGGSGGRGGGDNNNKCDGDGDALLDGSSGGSSRGEGARYYREVVSWDLSDPETLTPMAFAADVAENYGLTYAQAMDLAESIQGQLRAFVAEHCAYAPPVVLRDAAGVPQDPPPASVHGLYGDVAGPLPGGMPIPLAKHRTAGARSVPSSAVARAAASSDRGREKGRKNSKPPAKRRRSGDVRASSLKSKVEDEYRQEVTKRLLEESRRRVRARAGDGTLVGELAESNNGACHLCREQSSEGLKCWSFACGESDSHVYCEAHLSERLGMAVQSDPLPLMLDSCPICSLTCPCSICAVKLSIVAGDFKAKCIEQGSKSLADTVFDDLFEQSRLVSVASSQTTKPKASAAKTAKQKLKKCKHGFGPIRSVPKLPMHEFPREMVGNVDIDPATDLDYRTIYSARGASILQDTTATAPSTSNTGARSPATTASSQADDGTLNYCISCMDAGNLLCCDFCPRAFHAKCLDSIGCLDAKGHTNPTGVPWKCPACRREEIGIPDEKIDGSTSLPKICAAFEEDLNTVSGSTLEGLKVLSIIHQMLHKLIGYDFGEMFQYPVDCSQNPQYRTVIKKPMDLGSIASDLVNGEYKRRADGKDINGIITSVLKDIELVWHNCYTFNCEGSAIHRMATVQRNCARRIQQQSFDSLLSDEVRQRVKGYVLSCQLERAKAMTSTSGVRAPLRSPRSRMSRRKIAVASNRSNTSRPVAVLDPETGMLAKVYSSQTSATSVLNLFRELNFPCEWDFPPKDVYRKLCRIVSESKKETSFLLFGYRWLMLNDLRGGKVAFPEIECSSKEAPTQMEASSEGSDPGGTEFMASGEARKQIEMVDDGNSTFFDSVEEALACLGPEVDENLLRNLSTSGEFSEFAGRKWRFTERTNEKCEGTATLHPSSVATSSTNTKPDKGGSHCEDEDMNLIVKENLMTDSVIGGFDSVESAYNDWLLTIQPHAAEIEESKSIETFTSFYLDGVRAVGGVRWRRKFAQTSQRSYSKAEEREKTNGFGGTNGISHLPTSIGAALLSNENVDSRADFVSPLVPSRRENKANEGVNAVPVKNELATAS